MYKALIFAALIALSYAAPYQGMLHKLKSKVKIIIEQKLTLMD